MTKFGTAEENESEANYYSGEALLVLAMEAERGNKEAMEMCARAFRPYVLQFRQAPTTAFLGWHVNVWSRLARLTGNREYRDFAFEQIEWLLPMQIKSNKDSRWIGGFSEDGTPPRCSSVVFLEAIARALSLAIQLRDGERVRRYAESVRAGLQFCNRLRLEETPVTLLANPVRCQGGIAFDLVDRRVRCDSVQHFITLCLAVKRVKYHLENL